MLVLKYLYIQIRKRRPTIRVLLSSFIAFLASCGVSFEGVKQAEDARQFITEDLQSQIVFNLILAKNGLPFAQYDIQQVQSVVTFKAAPQGCYWAKHNNS